MYNFHIAYFLYKIFKFLCMVNTGKMYQHQSHSEINTLWHMATIKKLTTKVLISPWLISQLFLQWQVACQKIHVFDLHYLIICSRGDRYECFFPQAKHVAEKTWAYSLGVHAGNTLFYDPQTTG